MKNHAILFEDFRRIICRTMIPFRMIVFIMAIGLSITSCLDDPEGEWGGEPGTNPGGVGGGLNLADRLREINAEAESGSEHIIELTGSGNIGAQTLSFTGRSNITIRLTGDTRERIVSLTDNGSLFTIGSGVTLVLDDRVTLRGRSGSTSSAQNNAPLIRVNSGGMLIMKDGSKVTGNTNNNSNNSNGTAGVFVDAGGSFIMEGGEISGNTSSGWSGRAGGVYVVNGADFLMEGGKITNNTASNNNGGGVYTEGRFTMTNGEITYNTASVGGGVYLNNGSFTMGNGRIYGNTATTTSTSSGGGGVYVTNAAFTMNGGVIAFNTARSGGGVFVDQRWSSSLGTFVKNGGTIHGYTIGDSNRNTATAGISNSDMGHAVFVSSSPNKRRETTAGPSLNLDSEVSGAMGGWE